MNFTELDIQHEYRSLVEDIAKDFLIPLLKNADSYKRAVGYFSSSSLIEISVGIIELEKNDGKIQLIASPYLSDEDVLAIKEGYKLRDEIIKNAVLRELKDHVNDFEKQRLNLLAHLIAKGTLDIKIAFTDDGEKLGMYHEKMGILTDRAGNRIAFSGSMNETQAGFTLNYEAIDVFCSWRGELERVEMKEKAFMAIWNDAEPSIRTLEFPELKDEIINKYKTSGFSYEQPEIAMNYISETMEKNIKPNVPTIPADITFYDYQLQAIQEWKKQKFQGIFDMATGTGKTITGLGSVVELCKQIKNNVAVIIVCPFQHLVEQWVEDIVKFNINPIIGYSASSQKDWKRKLDNAIRDQKLMVRGKEFFCFICTNATFSSEYVQLMLKKIKTKTLLLVDEAHNFGSERLSALLEKKYDYRLALSATLDRHNDPKGTNALYDFFGEKCIEYTLEKAIADKKLTPYKYYPIIVNLNEVELDRYLDLSKEIGKCFVINKKGNKQLNEKGKKLAIKRARIVSGAIEKIEKLLITIEKYKNKNHILVYCGATNILQVDQDLTDTEPHDIKQIKVVSDILGNQLGMNVARFTSQENIQTREKLKREFALGETLQGLIAIKCLDEGVNIPQIKTAFILASTTNPKEYIQRRGRVLRMAPGKDYAEIYDFITMPRKLNEVASLTKEQINREITLVKNEIKRAEEFARLSMNMLQAEQTIDLIKEVYSINDYLINIEEEYINV